MEWIQVPEEGLSLREIRRLTNRAVNLSADVEQAAAAILEDVRANGDEAVRRLTKKFDGADLQDFRVTEEEIDEAVASVGEDLMAVLREAKENIEAYHKEQVRKSWIREFVRGSASASSMNPSSAWASMCRADVRPIPPRYSWIRCRLWWPDARPSPWPRRPDGTVR